MAERALHAKLRALIFFRAFFVTLLLGSAFLFSIENLILYPYALSYFIIALYCLTIVYAVILKKIKDLFLFGYVQLIVDVIACMALLSFTGGIESWFSSVLILVVMSSSIVLNKKAGYIIASMSSLLYALLLDMQLYRIIPLPFSDFIVASQFFYNIFTHILSFYVTAFLSGHLASRLKMTEERLEEKDTHLKDLELFNTKIIESLPSGLFTTDLAEHISIFNRAAERIIGLPRDSASGAPARSVFSFLPHPIVPGRSEELLRDATGAVKIIGITITTMKDASGQDTGFVGIFQDLTELKKLEREMKHREQWAAIGELSANIAHEIRNPLASIKGSIEMLREGKLPEHHRDRLMDIAVGEMERLNNIITDFLTYSSPKPLHRQDTDITSLLSDTMDILGNQIAADHSVSIRKELPKPITLSADPVKLRQVFWNIGINALEAMKDRGTLTVSAAEENHRIVIRFVDTGPGIRPIDQERIFFPFFTTKEKGTGLGLAIAYRIVDEHHGKITAQSTPDGTTFEIILERNGS